MCIIKEFHKTKAVCKVTFHLHKDDLASAKNVYLVGDFNDWDVSKHKMKKVKDGSRVISVDLKTGREYQFRYLLDESKWINDWNPDKIVRNNQGHSENSVIIL